MSDWLFNAFSNTKPLIALIAAVNVGKSTLFNRLAKGGKERAVH